MSTYRFDILEFRDLVDQICQSIRSSHQRRGVVGPQAVRVLRAIWRQAGPWDRCTMAVRVRMWLERPKATDVWYRAFLARERARVVAKRSVYPPRRRTTQFATLRPWDTNPGCLQPKAIQ